MAIEGSKHRRRMSRSLTLRWAVGINIVVYNPSKSVSWNSTPVSYNSSTPGIEQANSGLKDPLLILELLFPIKKNLASVETWREHDTFSHLNMPQYTVSSYPLFLSGVSNPLWQGIRRIEFSFLSLLNPPKFHNVAIRGTVLSSEQNHVTGKQKDEISSSEASTREHKAVGSWFTVIKYPTAIIYEEIVRENPQSSGSFTQS